MNVTHVPLLRTQRDLYAIPRGMERFRAYLRTMIDPTGDDLELPPLVAMNPMGKDHLPQLLDAYLGLDADGVAANVVRETARTLDLPGDWRIGLVLADDLHGGWTNRYASEFALHFGPGTKHARGWLSAVLWSGEAPALDVVQSTVRAVLHRAAYQHVHGKPRTLAERMRQEGTVRVRAGCVQPALDPEDLEYTRTVIAPYLDSTDMRTTIECLFGDAAGRTLGFTPRGLSPWAGLALALHDARKELRP